MANSPSQGQFASKLSPQYWDDYGMKNWPGRGMQKSRSLIVGSSYAIILRQIDPKPEVDTGGKCWEVLSEAGTLASTLVT